MECLTNVFDKLWEVRGSGTSDPECIAFAYKALDDFEWTGSSAESGQSTITNGDKSLLLIFSDCEAWALGHANYIEVIEANLA